MMNIVNKKYCHEEENKFTIDRVIPKLEEIYHCIKRGHVSKKELILYKLIIDFNEALYNQHMMTEEKAYNVLMPCSLRFYKQLSDTEVTVIMNKMQIINDKINTKVKAYEN